MSFEVNLRQGGEGEFPVKRVPTSSSAQSTCPLSGFLQEAVKRVACSKSARLPVSKGATARPAGEGEEMSTKKKSGRTSIVRADEEELIRRVRDGDRSAFRLLVDSYQSSLLVCALEVVKNRADAEDVVQESFVKAYLSLDKFRGQSSFYTWIYRITLNMAIDFRRKVARRGGDAYEFDETWGERSEGAVDRSPVNEILTKERLRELQSALDNLSDEHRLVILMREVEGMSYDEIAHSLGISVGTVMSRLHYGRKNLQQKLSPPTEEGRQASASAL